MNLTYGWERRWPEQHYVIMREGKQWTARSDSELTHAEITEALKTRPRLRGTRANITYNGTYATVHFELYTHKNYNVLMVSIDKV